MSADTKLLRHGLCVALLALAGCGGHPAEPAPRQASAARDEQVGDSVQRRMFTAWRNAQMPSVYGLIGQRERLQLTSPQVTALDSIAEVVRERNRPYADSLARFTRTGSGGPLRLPRNEAQQRDFTAILERQAENNREALAAIQQVLTPVQRDSVCALEREQFAGSFGGRGGRRGGGGFGGGGGGGGGRRAGMRGTPPEMRGDSAVSRGGGRWPWCSRGGRPGAGAGPARLNSPRGADRIRALARSGRGFSEAPRHRVRGSGVRANAWANGIHPDNYTKSAFADWSCAFRLPSQ